LRNELSHYWNFLFDGDCDLAPWKPTKFEAQMDTAMEDLTKKFEGVELMVTQILDKLTNLEAWRSTAEEATDRLLS